MIFRPYLALDLRTEYSPSQSKSGRRKQEGGRGCPTISIKVVL